MKKTIIIFAILLGLLSLYKFQSLPEETIRFRIIANSNSLEDQKIKKDIVKNIQEELLNSNANTIEEERQYLVNNLPTLEEKIKELIEDPFIINYGQNYFPEKEFQGITYEEGMYESLVITLGEGKGNNFWCILFPPLCMIDEEEDVEYKSFIKEAFRKIF